MLHLTKKSVYIVLLLTTLICFSQVCLASEPMGQVISESPLTDVPEFQLPLLNATPLDNQTFSILSPWQYLLNYYYSNIETNSFTQLY